MPTLGTLHGLTHEQALQVVVNPNGELDRPKPIGEAREELNRRDGYVTTPEEDVVRRGPQGLTMLFLADREGIIQWRWIEAERRPEHVGAFPDATELMEKAQTV